MQIEKYDSVTPAELVYIFEWWVKSGVYKKINDLTDDEIETFIENRLKEKREQKDVKQILIDYYVNNALEITIDDYLEKHQSGDQFCQPLEEMQKHTEN